ncbi:hypothetical protein [Lysinibacillus xylanilyticus]|uniref:hypothetical protein n=1 Tax=Lysinibacillus xylanilyticus TaxID=582475 RepID=UPI003CFD8FC6
MLGFTERQLMDLLKKVDIQEEQKETIANIVALNNQEIDKQLEHRVLSIVDKKLKSELRLGYK